jgi:hypothetical protein
MCVGRRSIPRPVGHPCGSWSGVFPLWKYAKWEQDGNAEDLKPRILCLERRECKAQMSGACPATWQIQKDERCGKMDVGWSGG